MANGTDSKRKKASNEQQSSQALTDFDPSETSCGQISKVSGRISRHRRNERSEHQSGDQILRMWSLQRIRQDLT
jgi:hypothetical protein